MEHEQTFEPGDQVMLVCPAGDHPTEGPCKVIAVVPVSPCTIYVVETADGLREASGVEMVAVADYQAWFRRTCN